MVVLFLFISMIVLTNPIFVKAQDSLNISLVARKLVEPPRATDCAIHDGIAYVVHGYNGDDAYLGTLAIMDHSNPSLPQQLGFKRLCATGVARIAIEQDLSVVGMEDTIEIIDVSKPLNVETLSLLRLNAFNTSIAVHDTFLYVATRDSLLSVYTLSDRANPVLIDTYPLDEIVTTIVPFGQNVILTGSSCRILTVDQNQDIDEVAIIDRNAVSLSIQDSLLAIGSGNEGIFLYDMTDIEEPEFLSSIDANGTVVCLWQDRLVSG